MVLCFGAQALWASGGLGWAPGTLHSVVSMERCAPSLPAPNSRFFKALLEPSLFPGWGQTVCAGFWAQKARRVQASGAFGSARPPLSSSSVAEFPAPGTPGVQLSLPMDCSPALYLCGPTGHWRFPWACNTGKHDKEALSCSPSLFLSLLRPRKGRRTFHLGRSDESLLKGL